MSAAEQPEERPNEPQQGPQVQPNEGNPGGQRDRVRIRRRFRIDFSFGAAIPATPFIERTQLNPRQLDIMNIRDQLFHSLFYRLALMYARLFPRPLRRLVEFIILLEAIALLSVLLFLHWNWQTYPTTCLKHMKDQWPRDGILRVELLRNPPSDYSIMNSYEKEYSAEYLKELLVEDKNLSLELVDHAEMTIYINASLPYDEYLQPNSAGKHREEAAHPAQNPFADGFTLSHFEMLTKSVFPEDQYVFEYSLEHGFLRLSPRTRWKLNITVMLVTLDPSKDRCFGNSFARFLLDEFLGYDDVLLASIKSLADKEENRGYVRNVITGEHYRFVSIQVDSWNSSLISFLAMLVFTVSISILLRYSHQQIFLFIVDVLQMFEMNVTIAFPAAPLLTVVLALVGIEAIMSEFFNDTTTAFYVILIVWVADQFDTFCCFTATSRRHWLRFFYLYHFAFYAYQYRYHGLYSGLALVTSWFFILHSMIYFFHHFELPAILQQARIHQIAVQAQSEPEPPSQPTDPVVPANAENVEQTAETPAAPVAPTAPTAAPAEQAHVPDCPSPSSGASEPANDVNAQEDSIGQSLNT